MSDQEMLQGLLARDETALRRIYELYGNYLRRIAGNILESPEVTLRTLEAYAAQPAKEAPPETPEAARKRRLGLAEPGGDRPLRPYRFWADGPRQGSAHARRKAAGLPVAAAGLL